MVYIMLQSGDVVELVDTLGLEPSAARRGGSTPSIPTISLSFYFKNKKIFGTKIALSIVI